MKRTTPVILPIILFLTVSAFAQDPPPPPPARPAPMPAWQEFSSTEGNFKILMPGTPVEQTQTVNTDIGPTPIKMFIGQNGVIGYLMMYAEYPIAFDTLDAARTALAGSRDMMVSRAGGKVVSDDEIKYGDYIGRSWKAQTPKVAISCRSFIIKQRLYALMATVPGEMDADKSVQKEVANFFASFKLLGEPKAPAVGVGSIAKLEAAFDKFELPEGFFDRPISWREFTSGEGGYKMQLPSEPYDQTIPLDPNNPKLKMTLLMTRGEDFIGLVMSQHLLAAPTDDAHREYLFKSAMNGLLQGIDKEAGKQGGARIVSEQAVNFKGNPGRVYQFNVKDGNSTGSGTCRAYSIGSNIYLLFAFSKQDQVKQADIFRFLDSFDPVKAPESMPKVGTLAIGPGAWREYADAGRGYKVMLPAEPSAQTSSESGVETHISTASGDGLICMVIHQFLPVSVEPDSPEADSFFDAYIKGFARNSNFVAVGEKKIAQDGRSGREYAVKREELTGTVRVFLRGREVHAVVAVPMGANDGSQGAKKFLDSFKMTDQR